MGTSRDGVGQTARERERVHGYYVVGGEQRTRVDLDKEWHHYRKARILQVDGPEGEARSVVEYVTPAELCPAETPSVIFKAGTRREDELFVCTQTEVLAYTLPDFRPTLHLSHPWLNDCHHVCPTDRGTFYVVSTGLDRVLELDREGGIVGVWDAFEEGEPPWRRYPPDTDFRLVPTIRPRLVHANFVFTYDGDAWVTRCLRRDAYCFTNPSRTIALGDGNPHDGVIHGDRAYFTFTNGRLVVVDLAKGEVERTVDLHQMMGQRFRVLGWCRGIHTWDGNVIVAGFSRLRPTRSPENVSWLKDFRRNLGQYRSAPTRIACIDLSEERLLWERELESHGLHAIFSIHPVEPAPRPVDRGFDPGSREGHHGGNDSELAGMELEEG